MRFFFLTKLMQKLKEFLPEECDSTTSQPNCSVAALQLGETGVPVPRFVSSSRSKVQAKMISAAHAFCR